MGVKLGPSSWQKGGGLALSNTDGVIKKARYEYNDFGGKVSPPQVTAVLTIAIDEQEDALQLLSCGKSFDGTPSADGKTVDLNGKSTGFNENTNWIIFLRSLVDAGFPAEKLEESDDITIIEGLEAHFMMVDAPERKGLKNTRTGKDGAEYKFQNLVVDKIHKMPWEGKNNAGGGGGDGGSEGGELESEVMDAVIKILDEAGSKGLNQKEIGQKLFGVFKSHPSRNIIIKMPFNKEFMEAGMWEFDGKIAKPMAA